MGLNPSHADWKEHGDMLALIVRARTGYKIIRKVKPPPMTEREALERIRDLETDSSGTWIVCAKQIVDHALRP